MKNVIGQKHSIKYTTVCKVDMINTISVVDTELILIKFSIVSKLPSPSSVLCSQTFANSGERRVKFPHSPILL